MTFIVCQAYIVIDFLMDNVTELYSKGFNVTIPEDTHYPDQNIGTWRSGAHGWWTFLKPLLLEII